MPYACHCAVRLKLYIMKICRAKTCAGRLRAPRGAPRGGSVRIPRASRRGTRDRCGRRARRGSRRRHRASRAPGAASAAAGVFRARCGSAWHLCPGHDDCGFPWCVERSGTPTGRGTICFHIFRHRQNRAARGVSCSRKPSPDALQPDCGWSIAVDRTVDFNSFLSRACLENVFVAFRINHAAGITQYVFRTGTCRL